MKKLLAAAILCLSFSVAVGSDPAGSDNEIQYSLSGVHAAEAGFEYDPATNTLTCESMAQPAAAAPLILLKDSTTSGETQISMTDAAGPDGVMSLEADVAGTLTTFLRVDGVNECVDIDYPLYLLERADAAADRAGYGQIWVNTATPNELWWTDDAGTDTQLGTGGHGNGANCAAGEIPLGVDASGAVEGCYEPAEADISDLAHTATAITDGLIVEADLDADEAPTDNDILTYDTTGANFSWQTPAELSLQPLDSDLTTIAGLTATSGNVMFAAGSAWTSDATPAIDCTDCTNIPAGSSHADTLTWSGTAILESGVAFQFGDATDATLTHTYANTGTNVDIAFSTGAMAVTGALTATNLSGTNTGDNDEVGTKTTGDLCINDGSSVNCTVNTIAELETALDAEDVLTATEGNAAYQPLEATLTDIADGTIDEDLVNTANPWAVNEGGTGAATLTDGGILLGSGTGAITALGAASNGQVPIGDGTTDPVLATITGTANEITVTNGAGTITIDIPASPTLDGTNFSGIPTSALTTEVRSMYWPAASFSSDGTNCADPAEVTLGSGPKLFTVICTDNDGSVINGHVDMPDGYNAGTVTFEMVTVNDNATPAGDFDVDFECHCLGNSDVIATMFGGTEQAADVDYDASGTCGGSACVTNEQAIVTTSAVTCDGTCAAGDMLFWQGSVDATGTTATVADVHILGVKMEYTTSIGD